MLASVSQPCCLLAHTQFRLAIRAVTDIKRSSRRLSAVISARAIPAPTILSTGPSGILKATLLDADVKAMYAMRLQGGG